jgi:hypothetical protein
MNLEQFSTKIESVKLGKSKGLLKSIFGVKVSDNMPITYANLKLKKLSVKSNVGDLVFFRLYSKGQPQMECSIGVVTKLNNNNFEYLTHKKGSTIKVISDYNLITKNGNCLLGFHTLIKD